MSNLTDVINSNNVNWLGRAAENGDVEAMNSLAICYDNGEGTEKNLEKAFYWYQKAAENGNKEAMNSLAICYDNGEGIEMNSDKAFYWYQKVAAENGNNDAMNNLATCYKNGEGTEKDLEKAFYWFQKAVKNGKNNATKVFLSSGNKVIDDFIKYTLINNHKWIGKMEFVSYFKFSDIEFVAEGGFSKIYKATWIDGPVKNWDNYDRNGKMTVALKELNNSKNINSKEINELKIYYHLMLRKSTYHINKYYGITQDPTTKNFMIIMNYYELGDLTHYITKVFFNTSWNDKLNKLFYMIYGLEEMHNANIIHKDYHGGNIFITNISVIGDLGISKSAIESSDDNDEIYGIIPYVAPEIFQEQKYTKASDIYSFGMVMWELMTGRKPFWDHVHDTELIIKICDGFQPPINLTNAPEGYIEVMQECWNLDPKKRPTSANLMNKILTMKNKETYNETKITKTPDIGPISNNPGAIYKSRSLSAMIKSAESTRNLRSQLIKFDKRKI